MYDKCCEAVENNWEARKYHCLYYAYYHLEKWVNDLNQ